jgi:hypothetical protein
LAPIFALEGHLNIYEAYATGPFAIRVAGMASESQERALSLVDEEDLPELLRHQPPAAMLGGLEGETEIPLVRCARRFPNCQLYALAHDWQSDRTRPVLRPLDLTWSIPPSPVSSAH